MNSAVFVGNLAADPKLITSKAGAERAVFSLALDEYNRDEDTPPTYVDVTVFSGKKDSFARNVAESLTKGKRVIVTGRATTYKVEAEVDGESKNITKTSFIATTVAPDLRWQSAKVTKVTVDRDDDPADVEERASGAPVRPTRRRQAGPVQPFQPLHGQGRGRRLLSRHPTQVPSRRDRSPPRPRLPPPEPGSGTSGPGPETTAHLACGQSGAVRCGSRWEGASDDDPEDGQDAGRVGASRRPAGPAVCGGGFGGRSGLAPGAARVWARPSCRRHPAALAGWAVASLRVCARLGGDLAGTHPQLARRWLRSLGVWLLVSAARSGLAAASPKDPRRAYSGDERQGRVRPGRAAVRVRRLAGPGPLHPTCRARRPLVAALPRRRHLDAESGRRLHLAQHLQGSDPADGRPDPTDRPPPSPLLPAR